MATVTITKKEYDRLIDAKLRYDYLRSAMERDLLFSPPTRDVKKVISSFRKTRRYNQQFLRSLARGLKRSSHFKA